MSKKKVKKVSQYALEQARKKRERDSAISGLIINFNDSDPLAADPSPHTVTGLPYGHKNPTKIKSGLSIFKKYRKHIFNNELSWVVTVTIVNRFGDPMRDPIEIAARCKIGVLTDIAESYIEQVMSEVDMDFYRYVNFSCLVKK